MDGWRGQGPNVQQIEYDQAGSPTFCSLPCYQSELQLASYYTFLLLLFCLLNFDLMHIAYSSNRMSKLSISTSAECQPKCRVPTQVRTSKLIIFRLNAWSTQMTHETIIYVRLRIGCYFYDNIETNLPSCHLSFSRNLGWLC